MDYSQILTEHLARARKLNDFTYADRAELFIAQAVRDLARCYRHYDLEKSDAAAFSFAPGQTIYPLPAETQTIIGIDLRIGSDNAFERSLDPIASFQAFNRARSSTSRSPRSYARFGRNIRLDYNPDQAYNGTLFHYTYPVDPDFATPTTPELEEVWHPHIVEYSVVIGGNAIGESVVTQQAAASLQLFLQMMPDARMADLAWPATHHTEADAAGNV